MVPECPSYFLAHLDAPRYRDATVWHPNKKRGGGAVSGWRVVKLLRFSKLYSLWATHHFALFRFYFVDQTPQWALTVVTKPPPHKEWMTDKRVHSAHSAVKQTCPAAETNAQSEPYCHPACLKVRVEENKHTGTWRYVEVGRIIEFSFSLI